MKFTIDWLKDHLETTASAAEIISTLERTGLPCENNVFAHPSWETIKIVRIIAKEKHPNADKLNLYTIEMLPENGLKTPLEQRKIVCGDSSLEIGNCVPYAAPGTIIPKTETAIKMAEIRGISSPGMLCSAQELLLPIERSGVLRCFDEDFGLSIAQAFESVAILEIEVTPNRGDVMSVRGIARNLAFHGLGHLKPLEISQIPEKNSEQKLIEIAPESFNENQCLGINVAKMTHKCGKTVAKISKRLELVGITPTELDLVDLSNYVAHEIGQPMHTFDFDKLEKSKKNEPILKISNLAKMAEFTALNGQEINLEPGTLVISDQKNVVSWPGIIGGNLSKIDENSSEILLETGVFKVDSIQRRRQKLYTTASRRFEYGVDIDNLTNALGRFCFLLGKSATFCEKIELKPKKEIKFEILTLTKILGQKIGQNSQKNWTFEDLKSRLEPRGFVFKNQTENDCTIEIPSYKFFDISTQNCIVEEFATGFYDEIQSQNLPLKNQNFQDKTLAETLSETAIQAGFNECVHFSISSLESPIFEINKTKRELANASNQNYCILRGSLIPQLLKTISWHKNNSYNFTQFFECGLIYGNFSAENDFKKTQENSKFYPDGTKKIQPILGTFIGKNDEKTQKTIFTAVSQNHESLLKILYTFFEKTGLDSGFLMVESEQNHLQNGKKIYSNSQKNEQILIGSIGKIHPKIAAEFELKDIFALEIYIENFTANLRRKKYKKTTDQVPIYKDISFKIEPNFEIGKLTNFLKNQGYNCEIFDIYPTKNLQNSKSVGLRFVFEENKILTTEEINQKIAKIISIVEKEFKITI